MRHLISVLASPLKGIFCLSPEIVNAGDRCSHRFRRIRLPRSTPGLQFKTVSQFAQRQGFFSILKCEFSRTVRTYEEHSRHPVY